MADTRYLNARHGIEIWHDTGTKQIIGGSSVPSEIGVSANIGSMYFCTNGKIYKKYGENNNDWINLVEEAPSDNIYVRQNNQWVIMPTVFEGDLTFFHGQEQRPSGIDAGNFDADTWVTRDINVVVYNNIQDADLEDNIITIPAGLYYIECLAPGYRVMFHQIRLYDGTNILRYGYSSFSNDHSQGFGETRSEIKGLFNFEAETNLQLQHICSNTYIDGLGRAAGFEIEIYSEIYIWRFKEG